MYLLGRLLLKGLAILYLIMAVIGFLGYLEMGEFSTNIFAFFPAVLGTYSIIIPLFCLVFTVVCWHLSGTGLKDLDEFEYNEDEDHDEDRDEVHTHNYNQNQQQLQGLRDIGRASAYRPSGYSQGRAAVNCRADQEMSLTDFPAYFAQDLTIRDDTLRRTDQYENLGKNFSTYFGQGKRSIYMPAKTLDLQGFRDYFRDTEGFSQKYDKAANDAWRKEDLGKKFAGQDFQAEQRLPEYKAFPEQRLPEYKAPQEQRVQVNNNQRAELPAKTSPARKLWKLPGLELLKPLGRTDSRLEAHNPKLLEDVLGTFGVTAKVVNISTGPLITRYELSPAPGTKISKIVNLADDIALALASGEIRIEAPIPGKAAVGIEIPRKHSRTVFFREVIESAVFRNAKGRLKAALGKDTADTPVIGELEKMPHLLVAGATGSGKSIFINCLINSLLYSVTPDEVKLLLIDPKRVELSQYNGIPHLIAPVVTDPKQANKYLKFIVKEMENRYELFTVQGVRDVEHYNKTVPHNKLPYFVLIIDELADLMMVASAEIEETICRLAQMARAAGIHLVIATQRPSVNVLTGLIKANIPSRISFAVSSQIDSRTILDAGGAEKLLGKGDMLYSPLGLNKPARVHGCFIDEEEIKNVIEHWQNQGQPNYLINEEQLEQYSGMDNKEETYDERFVEAGELVITTGVASASFLQRRLRVGYSRAARLMDMLEEAGVVGEYEGNKPREILMSLEAFTNKHCS